LRWHEPTKRYVDRRTTEGKTKKEIIHCLKRAVVRELYRHFKPTSTHHRMLLTLHRSINRLVKDGGWQTRKRDDGTTERIPPPHLDRGQPCKRSDDPVTGTAPTGFDKTAQRRSTQRLGRPGCSDRATALGFAVVEGLVTAARVVEKALAAR
jgi:hypothetical protein